MIYTETQRFEVLVFVFIALIVPLYIKCFQHGHAHIALHSLSYVVTCESLPAMLKTDHFVAELENCAHVVADEQNRTAFIVADLVHFAHTFLLKFSVSYSKNLIND